jgi:hypothetical protein
LQSRSAPSLPVLTRVETNLYGASPPQTSSHPLQTHPAHSLPSRCVLLDSHSRHCICDKLLAFLTCCQFGSAHGTAINLKPLALSSAHTCRYVKILKKHDKNVRNQPVYEFYLNYLHTEKWLSGDYTQELVQLSELFSKLRGDGCGVKNDDAAQVRIHS